MHSKDIGTANLVRKSRVYLNRCLLMYLEGSFPATHSISQWSTSLTETSLATGGKTGFSHGAHCIFMQKAIEVFFIKF